MPDEINLALSARLRHGDLWAAVRRLGSQAALARALGKSAQQISTWLALKHYPDRTDEFDRRLVEVLGLDWELLWPEALRVEIRRRRARGENGWASIDVFRTVPVEVLARLEGAGLLSLESPAPSLDLEEVRRRLGEALEALTPRERRVIERRHLAGDDERPTYRELGRELGVTCERVRQIELKALRKLQDGPGDLAGLFRRPE